MGMQPIYQSQITFLNVSEMAQAVCFFEEVLGLVRVCDFGWAMVWRTCGGAMLGAVDSSQSTLGHTSKEGVLVSLTVDNIEEMHSRLAQHLEVGQIESVRGLGFCSFFFTALGGYAFEIQQFDTPELRAVFG